MIMGQSSGTFSIDSAPGDFLAPGAGVSTTEANVEGVVPVTATFTRFDCKLSSSVAGTTVFTVRINGVSQTGTCDIASGQTSGSNTGVSITVTAGQELAVQVNNAGDPEDTREASFGLAG